MKTSITHLLIKSASQLKGYFSLGFFLILIIPNLGLVACEEANNLTPDNKDSTQVKPCETNHTGDWCFKNSLSEPIKVRIDYGKSDERNIVVQKDKTACIYDLKSGRHDWDVRVGIAMVPSDGGEIRVIECKDSITIIE